MKRAERPTRKMGEEAAMRHRRHGLFLLVGLAAGLMVLGMSLTVAAPDLEPQIKIDKIADAEIEPLGMVVYETWYLGASSVGFDHPLHVDGGIECGNCHHMESCKHCHQAHDSRTIVINARIAIHESCFRCHEQGAGGSDCLVCHVPQETEPSRVGVLNSDTLGKQEHEKLLGHMHDDIDDLELVAERSMIDLALEAPPSDKLFITNHNTISTVLFHHQDHVEKYGLSCGSCHHMNRCGRCHGKVEQEIVVTNLQHAVRDNCVNCHERRGLSTACDHCHYDAHRR